MKVIIIIPAYNEAENLYRVITDIKAICPSIDYIIINDCSRDGTVELCRRNGYAYLDLYANLGFSGAVQTGYKYAKENGYDIAVQFDGDGQHPAAAIPAMVELIESDKADYVLGSRFVDRKKPWSARMLGSRILSTVIWLRTGRRIKDPTSGFRAIRRDLIIKMADNLNFIAEPDTLTRALLGKARVIEVQADMRERIAGQSHFGNPLNSVKYMLRMVLSILFFQGRSWR